MNRWPARLFPVSVADFRIKFTLKVLIIIFWIGQIWTSPYYKKTDFESYNFNGIISFIDSILQENTLIGNRFSLYEVSLLLLGIILLKNYKGNGSDSKLLKNIFYISLLVVAISFLNPNNSITEIKYFFTNDPRLLLYFIFLLYVFLNLDRENLWGIIYYFIYYGLIVAVSQALVSSFLFITGNGIEYLGSSTVLPNSEILNVLIFFCSISLSLYFKTRQKRYLLVAILFHFTVIFSDRRTPILVMSLADILIFVYYNKVSLATLLRVIVIIVSITAFYLFFISNQQYDFEYHFLRIYSMFNTSAYQGEYLNDMGHLEQTARTFNTILTNLSHFWGAGMRNTYFYVEGQSGYIHNNFAAVWALYGLHMTLYLMFILIVFVKISFQLIRKSFQTHPFPLKAAVIITSMFLLVGDAFTGEYFCKHFCYVSFFVLSLSFLRLTEEDEEKILLSLTGNRIKDFREANIAEYNF